MDSQLAFFLVRPAKAMGRKGADPDAVILAGHWSTPADRTNDVPICKPDFFTRKMWGWGVTSPEAVAPGTAMTGPGQGCSGEGLPCAQPLTFPSPSHADGQGRVSALGSLGLTPPRAGFEPDLAPHCTPKASFAARGGIGMGAHGGTAGLVGLFGVTSHPQGQHGWAQRWQWGDPRSPALLSQSRVGTAGGVPPKTVSDGGWDPARSPPVPRSWRQ